MGAAFFGGAAEYTVGGNQKDPKTKKDIDKMLGREVQPESILPSLTDESVLNARRSQAINTRRGRRSTFLTGAMGDTSAVPASAPSLFGSMGGPVGPVKPVKRKTLLGGY